jgi:hypothetical protein
MEATVGGGQPDAVAALNLLIPIIVLFYHYVLNKTIDRNILRVSFVMSLICIGYFSYQKQQIFGYLLTAAEAISEGGSETKYQGGITAIANVLAVLFFNDAKSLEI